MAINTTTQRNNLATAYGTNATHGAIFTSTGPSGNTASNEVTGGTYARQALTWGTASAGAVTATATFNVPAGTTVTYAGVASSVTAGAATVLDYGTITSQNFATAGTLQVTYTFTVT